MKIAQVAVPSPLHRVFDYFWPDNSPVRCGQRVTVPFGRRSLVGIVVAEVENTAVADDRMRRISTVHEAEPLLPADVMKLLRWSSSYYHFPIGEVLSAAIPAALRKSAPATLPAIRHFRLLCDPAEAQKELARAPLQRALVQRLATAGNVGLPAEELKDAGSSFRSALKQLEEKNWVESYQLDNFVLSEATDSAPSLSQEQQVAVSAVSEHTDQFQCFLLNGVTGSGKTEVYLQLIQQAVESGHQALVLVPEISLTPQLLGRFKHRISGCIVSLHSGLNDTERLNNWLVAAAGKADVVIGTRSAVFTPLPRLQLVIIDEEHDGSLKQQDGFRYHARDLALMRARDRACPVVLGSATPSLESLKNVSDKRFRQLRLSQRAGDAEAPGIALLDIRRRRLTEGMSDRLLQMMRENLDNGGQSLVFINRRGFAPTLLCNDCGAAANCKRCDAHMTVHARLDCLRCHHCGAETAVPLNCEACQSSNLDKVGYGTERIEAALLEAFPGVPIARIDRDSTRRKGALEKQLDEALSGRARILVGTQMLAKGHHFPGVTLVGILDCDRGLYGTDFRALEQMGQLIVQVAGRAGREKKRGQVLVQTRNPDNELLQVLVQDGYNAFARLLLQDRGAALLPPFSYVALVRAEATDNNAPHEFLTEVAKVLESVQLATLQSFGPVAAPMERRGGRYRAQLMVQSPQRAELNQALAQVCLVFEASKAARKIRWSIDVDPVDFL